MAERRRQRAQASLADARRRLDAGDIRGAVELLERARSDFAAELDLDGVRDVRAEAERGYREAAESDEPFYEQLLYASAQNVRFLSRRDATRRGVAWVDPHPELDLPGRPEIRAERGISRTAKVWIIAVSMLVLAAGGGIAAWAVVAHETAWVVNDRSHSVDYASCGSGVLTQDRQPLAPGERKRFRGWNLCVEIIDFHARHAPNVLVEARCLHLHDGEVAKVSDASRCD